MIFFLCGIGLFGNSEKIKTIFPCIDGLAENKAVNQVLAQITGSTETSNPPGDGWTGMYMNCYNQYGNKTGQRYVCYQPGYKTPCIIGTAR